MTGKCYNILIVDDDQDNASSLCELFEYEGHKVTVVHSGEQAITAYLGRDFDVAFMDVMMPGKNGVESFLEIRRMRPTARVIMMTGYSVEQLLNQAMANGAMGVLTKPMDSRKVLGMLDDLGPGSVVVSTSGQSGEHMHRMLSAAGRTCRLIREPRGLMFDPLTESGSVLIFDINRSLIESFGYFAQMRDNGCSASAVIMLEEDTTSADAAEALRNFAVTGVLNKPFDPLLLLEKLSLIAA